MASETISQYKIEGAKIIDELIKFAKDFETTTQNRWSGDRNEPVDEIIDSEDEDCDENMDMQKSNLFTKLDEILKFKDIGKVEQEKIDLVEDEIQRMLRMFYLHMRVKGMLKEFKDDYFV